MRTKKLKVDKSKTKGFKVLKAASVECLACMEEHIVLTVVNKEEEEYRGKKVEYEPVYDYCYLTDDLLEDEELIRENSKKLRKEYVKLYS